MAQQHAKAPPLGKLLKDNNLVTEQQIVFSLHEQKATGERMGQCLMRLGIITDSDLARVLSQQSGLPYIDLRTFTPDTNLLMKVPYRVAKQFQFLVLFGEGQTLHIAIADPFSQQAIEQAYRTTGQIVKAHVGGENELHQLIERFYFLLENPIEEEINAITAQLLRSPEAEVDIEKLVDNLFGSAVSYRVTDMHITASDLTTRIMFRIDGVMQLAHVFANVLHSRLITTLKVRAGMDISEQRKPQDGRLSFDFLGETFDVRISTVRTNFGENMVLRLLPSRGTSAFSIRDLGLEQEKVDKLEKLFSRPHGMVLVSGPTGSGKTTTLYAALRSQDAIGQNILTVEDPIEYELLMIRQTQVNERAGYTFATAIRTFLRQDPDVILVGEVRDEETAILAVRAALTGHLVLSTLHTNTALGAIARLKDLGITNYLLSTALVGVLAQRLVRKLCVHCKVEALYTEDELAVYDLPVDHTYYRAAGCNFCSDTGYTGRECVSEVIEFTDPLLRLIAEDAPLGKIEDQARLEGFTDLMYSARQKILAGTTSLEEILRVIG
jgi:type IV pilus assembly protein PilB